MSTIADQAPELVHFLSEHNEGPAGFFIARFQKGGNGSDLVAYIPPSYDQYAILDREHRGTVQEDDLWIASKHRHGKAVFAVPVAKLDAERLLSLSSELRYDLARLIADARPDLATSFENPDPPEPVIVPGPDPEEVRHDERLAMARKLRELATELDGAVTRSIEAAKPRYLADANLFINAHKGWGSAKDIIAGCGVHFELVTTKRVYDELKHRYDLPDELHILTVPSIDADLKQAAQANADALTGKKAGRCDLSLLQAARDHPELAGVITEDMDLHNLHPASLVGDRTHGIFRCLRSRDFVAAHPSWV